MKLNGKALSLMMYAYANGYTVEVSYKNEIHITDYLSSPAFSVFMHCIEINGVVDVGIFDSDLNTKLSVDEFYAAFSAKHESVLL
ncbi:hypothetical protein DRV69_24855 [Salmonella enterica subsp. diarizonae]|nr:hypothetical protein [Salmonella enterica subsp. diarizonae]